MDKNITIPLPLFHKIIDMLAYWNAQEYCEAVQQYLYSNPTG